MSLFISSINSGSNGNCYYVGNLTDAVLIDVGISCMETEKRMKQRGLSMKNVKAIFVSHEHTDHIKGVSTLANKYHLPVYISAATAAKGPRLIKHLSRIFTSNEKITVGDLTVTAFTKQHDASNPHSFIINGNGITVGVFTDIGMVCNEVVHYFKQCDAAFLESNYDEDLLENSSYSAELKNRIRGGQGHLSNRQALELFTNHKPAFMTRLVLSHLSGQNNSPQIVQELFYEHAAGTIIVVASRNEASEVYSITKKENK
jgi:phosphoribosyl 1,2-cyclic phosphodiesterase